jgi:hypothetical protein
MKPEVEFALDLLGDVVAAQPADSPLRRVDRDNSLRFDGNDAVDMTQSLKDRKEKVKQANYVGVRSVSRDNAPYGQDYRLDVDLVLSVRIEGLHHSEYGHVDPSGQDGVVWDTLCRQVRNALNTERTYPDHPAFEMAHLDLQVTNEDHQSANLGDFYRREFDVIFRAIETPPQAVAGFGVTFGRAFGGNP